MLEKITDFIFNNIAKGTQEMMFSHCKNGVKYFPVPAYVDKYVQLHLEGVCRYFKIHSIISDDEDMT